MEIRRKMRRNRAAIFFLLTVLLLTTTGCFSSKAAKRPKLKPPDPNKVHFIHAPDLKENEWEAPNYRIEPDDVLEISVWQIEDLQKEVVVRPDGKISFPLIGDVQAQGKTIDELRQEVVDKIKLYIKVPQVSVNIKEFGGKRAIILGEVMSPGVIRFTSPIRISEAIALSQGLTGDANKGAVFIIRDLDREEPTVIVADIGRIFFQGDLKENALIKQGDIVYVQVSLLASMRDFMYNTFGPIIGYVEAYYGPVWRRQAAPGPEMTKKWRWPTYQGVSPAYQYSTKPQ